MKTIAVIRVRGQLDVNPKTRKALELLGLKKKHSCRIMPWNSYTQGQVHQIKDFVAWGEINAETIEKLLEKKEIKDAKKTAQQIIDGKTVLQKPVFNLHPPIKGFPRKGIRQPASRGGALGFNKNFDQLLRRML